MWANLAIVILVILPCVVRSQEDYCTLGEDHTMCQYQPCACNQTAFKSGITDQDKQDILTVHNQLRQKVATGNEPGQPQAANMEELLWDDEIATIAQRWADQCTFGHDANRNTDDMYVGQNVAETSSTSGADQNANFTYATYMWYNEVSSFDPNDIDPFDMSSGAGHYTQVVWADTRYIGCGFSFWEDSGWYNKFYVCNYGPGGNIIGGSMYKVGPPASQCSSGIQSTSYPGLCN